MREKQPFNPLFNISICCDVLFVFLANNSVTVPKYREKYNQTFSIRELKHNIDENVYEQEMSYHFICNTNEDTDERCISLKLIDCLINIASEKETEFSSHTKTDIYINILLLFDCQDLYCEVKDAFDIFSSSLESTSFAQKFELPQEFAQLCADKDLRHKVRVSSWKAAISSGYVSAVELFINKDGGNITVTEIELDLIYEMNPNFITLLIENKFKIKRSVNSPVSSVFAYYCSDINCFRDDENRSIVNIVDLFNIQLQHQLTDKELVNTIDGIKNIQTAYEAIGLAVILNKYTMIELLIASKNFKYDSMFVVIAIEHDAIETLFVLINEYPQDIAEDEHVFINPIVTSFSKSNYCWLAKLHMLKQVITSMSYRKCEELLSIFEAKVHKDRPQDNPLYFATNTLLVILNLYEACMLIENEYSLLSATVTSITSYIIKVGAVFVAELKEDRIRPIVHEPDFERRDALDIISKYSIAELLESNNMQKVSLELWESQYDVKGNVFECSSAFSIVKLDMFAKARDYVDEYMFYNFKQRNLSKFAHHMFQFKVWKKSMKARFLIETMLLLCIAVAFQYYLLGALSSGDNLDQIYSNITSQKTSQTDIDNAFQDYANDAIQYYDDMKITVYISIVSFFYPIRIVLEALFAVKTKRKVKLLTFTNLLDCTFCIVFVARLVKEYAAYEVDLNNYTQKHLMAVRYYENIYEYNNDSLLIDFIYCIGAFVLWVRFLMMFRLTQFLGPLIKIISLMAWEIIIFMVLFTIVLVIYSSVGTLLFYSVDAYQDFWTTFITLFSGTLGNFDFTVLSSQAKGEFIGDIYLLSFLILTAILLLNLLVAILTSVYSSFEDKKFVLYIFEILKLRSTMNYDKRASGLVSTCPPWNVLPLVLSPLYFTKMNESKLNNFVLHVCYVPVLVVTAVVFVAFNLVMIPFAYIKGVAIKLKLLFYRKPRAQLHRRVLSVVFFVIAGGAILLMNLLVDMIFFFKHMYQTSIRLKSEKLQTKKMLSNSFEVVETKIRREIIKGLKTVKFVTMSIYICNKLEIPSLIQQAIYDGDDTKYLMDQIKDFSLLKRVFDSGSILADCEKVMILPIWKSILSELKAYSKVRQIIGYNNVTSATPKNNTVTPKTNNNDSNDYLWRIICISVFEVDTAIYKVNMIEPMSNYNSSCFKAFNNTLENDKSYQLGPKPSRLRADDELRSNLVTSRQLLNSKSNLTRNYNSNTINPEF